MPTSDKGAGSGKLPNSKRPNVTSDIPNAAQSSSRKGKRPHSEVVQPKKRLHANTKNDKNNQDKDKAERCTPNAMPQQMHPFVMRIMRQSSQGTHATFTPQEEEFLKKCTPKEANRLRKLVASNDSTKEPRRLRVLRSKLPEPVKMDIFRQLADNDSSKFEEWVERALKLPIGKFTPLPECPPAIMIQKAQSIMENEITGHFQAKLEVLRMLSNWINGGSSSGFAVGLEGEPGVGKTSFAKRAIAQSMGRPFCFISLGGASDASGLLGHGYTYEGAVPGRLVECLTTAQTCDPIIFFDELDKISGSAKGEELVHALIHLTDPVQNNHVRDRYFHGINIDLSRAILVFSYNDPSRVNPILLDRIRRIRLQSQSREERIAICAKHIIPRALASFPDYTVEVTEDIIAYIVDKNLKEAGMRGIEKDISEVISSYYLALTAETPSVLGLSGDKVHLDISFVQAVLKDGQGVPSYLTMYN